MKKLSFALLSFLLVFAASCQKDDGDGKVHSGLPKGQIKVMSYNIRGITNEDQMRNNWAIRAGASRDMMIDQKASVIGVQEANDVQVTYLMGVMEPRGYATIGDLESSNPILYLSEELEVLDFGNFWQSTTPDRKSDCWDGYERIVRWVVFESIKSGDRFFFVNSHLGLTSEAQSKGVSLIATRIKMYNTDNLPVIFTADCNVVSTSSTFDKFKETMDCTRDVAPVTDDVNTYNAWGNEAKAGIIDHIWVSKDLECLEYKTVTKAYDGHHLISDHYPVYSIVKF